MHPGCCIFCIDHTVHHLEGEFLIRAYFFTDLFKDIPFLTSKASVRNPLRVLEIFTEYILIDAGKGIIEFVLIPDPDPPDRLQFLLPDQFEVPELLGSLFINILLYPEQVFEPFFTNMLQVGAVEQLSVVSLQTAVRAAEISALTIAFFVAKRLSTLDDVLQTSTSFLLKTYKYRGRLIDASESDEREKYFL